MFTFLVIVQIITCIALVVVVLLQQGKGAEIGAVFGSSEAIFGSAGPAPFLAKVTAVLATIFMCTSIALTYLSAHQNVGSVMQGVKQQPINMPAPPPTLPSKAPATTTAPAQTTTNASTTKKNIHITPTTTTKETQKVNTIKTNTVTKSNTSSTTSKVTGSNNTQKSSSTKSKTTSSSTTTK